MAPVFSEYKLSLIPVILSSNYRKNYEKYGLILLNKLNEKSNY